MMSMKKTKQLLFLCLILILTLIVGFLVYRLRLGLVKQKQNDQPQTTATQPADFVQEADSLTILQPAETWVTTSDKYKELGGQDFKLIEAKSQRKSRNCEDCTVAVYNFTGKNNQTYEVEVSVKQDLSSVEGINLIYPANSSKYYSFFLEKDVALD